MRRAMRSTLATIGVALGCFACASPQIERAPEAPVAKVSPPSTRPQPPGRALPKEPAPKDVPPPPPEPVPAKGEVLLTQGVRSYEDGDYRSAAKQLQAALQEPLAGAEQASAHKYLAFVACASGRIAPCRDEFRKALAADPAFELAPAEAGHPTWGPAFRRVKAESAAKAKDKRALAR